MTKDLIKQDINFLENPMWIQDDHVASAAVDGYSWTDGDGYVYRARESKPPVKTDQIFLLYLLMQSQKNGWTTDLVLTRHQILKGCGLANAPYWYARIEDSLDRWESVRIKFEGTFYDGKEYANMTFGIIDSWTLEAGTHALGVRLSPFFIERIKNSTFFRYLRFDEIKALHSPLATRLYEIVSKMFQGRSFWEIGCLKLAQKIPMNEKYPADIIPKIQVAVNRINAKTSLRINLHVRREKRGTAFLGFEKIANSSQVEILEVEHPPLPTQGARSDETIALLALVREEHRENQAVARLITASLRTHEAGYVERNILYTNAKATTGYSAYLARALKSDYGLGWAEEQKATRKKETADGRKLREALKEQHEKQRDRERKVAHEKRVRNFIKNLSAKALEKLEKQALAEMPDEIRALVQAGGIGSKQILAVRMEQVAATLMPEDEA